MKVYLYTCPACGYSSQHALGTPDMDQILTDVNTEFAQYQLFVCKQEHKFVHADVQGANFTRKCPSDSTDLEEVPDIEKASCPRCNQPLQVKVDKPLSAGDSAGE